MFGLIKFIVRLVVRLVEGNFGLVPGLLGGIFGLIFGIMGAIFGHLIAIGCCSSCSCSSWCLSFSRYLRHRKSAKQYIDLPDNGDIRVGRFFLVNLFA